MLINNVAQTLSQWHGPDNIKEEKVIKRIADQEIKTYGKVDENIGEIRRILAAIDGSEKSEKALMLAVKIAKKFEAEVEIFTVIPRLILPFYGSGPTGVSNPIWMDEYYKEQENYCLKILKESSERMEKLYPEVNIKTKMTEGDPATMIVKEAEGFDLVVIGSRGHGFVEELFLGSVSKRVVDKSPVPVLVEK